MIEDTFIRNGKGDDAVDTLATSRAAEGQVECALATNMKLLNGSYKFVELEIPQNYLKNYHTTENEMNLYLEISAQSQIVSL